MITDMERFNRIDEVRRVCDQQGVVHDGDSWTRENVAWVFEKARLQIEADECRARNSADSDGYPAKTAEAVPQCSLGAPGHVGVRSEAGWAI